jgi:signal peptidase II
MLKSISIGKKAIFLVVLVLMLDQIFKIWIKTHMMIGQEYQVIDNWFIIHFTENNGMAFGMEFGGKVGKIILSLFRIAAIAGIAWYLNRLIQQKAKSGLILSVALILAGAIGNILDSMFYGMIFNESYGQVAALFPPEGGYSTFLNGKVVDMLYFPIIHGQYPHWFPFLGSQDFLFFRPVFNLADSSITLGVLIILLFQKQLFGTKSATASTFQEVEQEGAAEITKPIS